MNKLLIGVMATMLAQAACTVKKEDWVLAGFDGENFLMGNAGSREKNRAWFEYRDLNLRHAVYVIYPKQKSHGRPTKPLTRNLIEMNCSERKFRILASKQYNRSEQVVQSATFSPLEAEWQNVISNIGEIEHRFICEHHPR